MTATRLIYLSAIGFLETTHETTCAGDPAKVPVLRDKPNCLRVNRAIETIGVYRHRGRKLPRLLLAFPVMIYDTARDPRNFAAENFATRSWPESSDKLDALLSYRSTIKSALNVFWDVYLIADDCEIIVSN